MVDKYSELLNGSCFKTECNKDDDSCFSVGCNLENYHPFNIEDMDKSTSKRINIVKRYASGYVKNK